MAAKKGNDYNLKWTKEKAEKFFNDALTYIKENKEIYLLEQIAEYLDTYPEIFSYLLKKYQDFQAIKRKIDSILKSRVIDKGYSSGGATMSIFILMNNYDMVDKRHLSGETKPTVNVDIKALPKEDQKKLLKAMFNNNND